MIHQPAALLALGLLLWPLVPGQGLLLTAEQQSGASAPQVRTPGTEDDGAWVEAHISEAFEMLMPVETEKGVDVAYRQYRDLYRDVPERYFAIRVGHPEDPIEATVITPEGASIQRQLLDLRAADRRASIQTLVSRVAVRRQPRSSTTCAALRPRLDALSAVTVSMPRRDTIFLHPFVHRIVVSRGGEQIDATLYDNAHPLVRWADATFAALSRCPAARQGAGAGGGDAGLVSNRWSGIDWAGIQATGETRRCSQCVG